MFKSNSHKIIQEASSDKVCKYISVLLKRIKNKKLVSQLSLCHEKKAVIALNMERKPPLFLNQLEIPSWNWSHRRVMSSKLLSSVCDAPRHHKSTSRHKSLSTAVQSARPQHELCWPSHSLLTAGLNDALSVLRRWCFAAGMFMEELTCACETNYPFSPGCEWRRQPLIPVLLSTYYFSSSPRDPSVVRNVFIDGYLLLLVCFCASI